MWVQYALVVSAFRFLSRPHTPALSPLQVGTERAIPTSVATALSKEIKDFIEDEAPLMMLMSSPGIKKRHWDQIVKTTGISLPYEQDFVLRDLLDAGLQNFCAEIEEVDVSRVVWGTTFSLLHVSPNGTQNHHSRHSIKCPRCISNTGDVLRFEVRPVSQLRVKVPTALFAFDSTSKLVSYPSDQQPRYCFPKRFFRRLAWPLPRSTPWRTI